MNRNYYHLRSPHLIDYTMCMEDSVSQEARIALEKAAKDHALRSLLGVKKSLEQRMIDSATRSARSEYPSSPEVVEDIEAKFTLIHDWMKKGAESDPERFKPGGDRDHDYEEGRFYSSVIPDESIFLLDHGDESNPYMISIIIDKARTYSLNIENQQDPESPQYDSGPSVGLSQMPSNEATIILGTLDDFIAQAGITSPPPKQVPPK